MPVPTIVSQLTHKDLAAISLSKPTSDRCTDVAEAIVRVISSYLYLDGPEDQFHVSGRGHLKALVARYIEKNAVIELVLPAFPDKSPSRAKVLGTLPDMAEEVMLRRLEDLCKSIEDLYKKGAVLHIVSDGIVYSEILQISDRVIFQYNLALRELVKQLELSHINFVRIANLLQNDNQLYDYPTFSRPEMTEEEYVQSAPSNRKAFLERDIGEFDIEQVLKDDVGVLRTYRGYKKFLQFDLEGTDLMKDTNGQLLSGNQRKKVITKVAKHMLCNGARFSHLIESTFPHSIRLSIHPHNNSGPKLALRVFPWGDIIRTPWHNALCEKKDGSTIIGHVRLFSNDYHEIVYRSGRPYLVREKDEDMLWDDESLSGTSFERLHPFGLKVLAPQGRSTSFEKVPTDKVQRLVGKYEFVLFSGFYGVKKGGSVSEIGAMV
ncbi:hypothetical protein FRC02_007969 [Tulasnella sp. 418]|nr:hypothetical protein FRC02_007969 [Tulasnella sp. 418]